MNLRIVDLHTHSSASDGDLSPRELVSLAAARNVDVMALTDHDTVAGVAEASAAAKDFGIRVVPGIEISAVHREREYHVLGYFVDTSAVVLSEVQQMMSARRDQRLMDIVDRLCHAGVHVDADDIRRHVPGMVTRSHIADLIVREGYAATRSQAFERYLGMSTFGYEPAGVLSVEATIGAVHQAGGCASLAHPGEWTPERDIREFAASGLDAIEVIHPAHDERLRLYYGQLADSLGLLKTGGTDFHRIEANGKEDVYPGDESVDAAWLDRLEHAASRRRGIGHR